MAFLMLMSLTMAAFLYLAYDVWRQQAIGLDTAVLEFTLGIASAPLTVIMTMITHSASVAFTGALLTLLGIRWWRAKRLDLLTLLITTVGAVALNEMLKAIFARPRPSLHPALIQVIGYSFPSGHSTIALAFFGMLAYLLGQDLPRRPRLAVYAAAGVWITLVGFSRAYLGVHYASDIVGAYAVTLPWVVAVMAVHACQRRSRNPTPIASA